MFRCTAKATCGFIAGALFASAAIAAQPQLTPKQKEFEDLKNHKFEHQFHPKTIQPYLNDLNDLANAMKAVTTPQQAAAFSEKFRTELPRLERNMKPYIRSYEHGAHAHHFGLVTPEIKQAGTMLDYIEQKGAEVEAHMVRIVKLYPQSEAYFKRYMDLHE